MGFKGLDDIINIDIQELKELVADFIFIEIGGYEYYNLAQTFNINAIRNLYCGQTSRIISVIDDDIHM